MNVRKQFSFKNHILSALPADSLERLMPHLEHVELPLGKNLYRAREPISHVYFPENAMASIVATTAEGQCTEIGVVGREGAVGLEVLMGVDSSPHECMIQIPNSGYRLATAALRTEFNLGGQVHDVLLNFIHKLMIQISQTTLCNRLHTLDERLARWLLMCYDRVGGGQLNLTQEFLAIMLGVSRVTVTLAASELQTSGQIQYARGRINITDRGGLEGSCCECYQIVRSEYDGNGAK